MTRRLSLPDAPLADRSTQIAGLTLAALGAALFSTKGIIVKLALAEGLDPVTILTWRMLISVPIFVIVGWWGYRARARRRPSGTAPGWRRGDLAFACGVGVLGYYGASYLDFAALAFISAQLNRLVLLTYPFFVLLIGAAFFGRRLSLGALGAAGIAYLGIALIFTHDLAVEGAGVLPGVALILGSAIIYALYQLLAKPLIDRMGAQLFTSVAMTAAGVVVAIHFLLTHSAAALLASASASALPLMATLAIVSTVLPAYCLSAAIGWVGPERTAVFGNISPLVTIVLAVLVLGETFTLSHALGTALVFAGILLFTRLTGRV